MDINIFSGRISIYIERELVGRNESWKVEFESARNFLVKLKKEFKEEDNQSAKMAKLKRIEQRSKTIKKFVHKLSRGTRNSRYKEYTLLEKF